MSIFNEEVEKTSNEIAAQSSSENQEVPEELRDTFNQMNSLVRMNPEFAESDEYKDLMAKISSSQASSNSNDEDNEEDDEDEEAEEQNHNSTQTSTDSDEEEDDEDEEEEEFDENDVFGLGKQKKVKKVNIDFEVPKEMTALLKSKFGIENAETFFNSVDTWRAQAQESSDNKGKLDALVNDIQRLPPDLRNALTLYADGEDYTEAFVNGFRLDFTSDFQNQDIESLVEHYLPEEYESLVKKLEREDIDEEEFEDKVTLLARSTKKMFATEKEALINQRAQYEKDQAELDKKRKSSALSSAEALGKSYPNFKKSELDRVTSFLVEDKIDTLFYNADGSFKENAAQLVADALYGEKMRKHIETLAKRRGKSEAFQETVASSPKKVKGSKSTGGQASGKQIDAVQHLSSVVTNDSPY